MDTVSSYFISWSRMVVARKPAASHRVSSKKLLSTDGYCIFPLISWTKMVIDLEPTTLHRMSSTKIH